MASRLIVIVLVVMGLTSPTYAEEELRKAVRTGDVARVKSLLDSGASVDTRYENNFTPIYFAEDPAIVSLLIAHGATLDIRDRASIQSPIERFAERFYRDEKRRDNWKAIVERLRAAGAEYTIDTAIYTNDIDFVREKLANDASWVNNRGDAQNAPLRVAVRSGRTEICRLLLENKADPDAFEEGCGYPIIYEAVGHHAVVKLLLDYNANLRRRITWRGGRSGVWLIGDEATALHYATSAGNLESVKLLIAAGADPNATDDKGQTPLHIAIVFERWEQGLKPDRIALEKIMECLLNNDASLHLMDKSGNTPLELANALQSPETIREMLKKKQAEIDDKYRRVQFGGP